MTIPIEKYLPAENYEEALGRACRMWGVQEEYWDIWGNRHIASAEVRRAVLTSLGVAAGSTEALNAAMEERTWNEWSSVVSRTLVESQSAASVPIHVPIEFEGGRLQVEFDEKGLTLFAYGR